MFGDVGRKSLCNFFFFLLFARLIRKNAETDCNAERLLFARERTSVHVHCEYIVYILSDTIQSIRLVFGLLVWL